MEPSLNQSHSQYTLHTKLLIDDSVLDRKTFAHSIEDVNATDRPALSSDDFSGGPICPAPADSSCGFHNTLSVLESHLNKNFTSKLSQQQIENLLLENKDVVRHHISFIDVPINDQRLPSISDNIANKKNKYSTNDEKLSSSFEHKVEENSSVWDKVSAINPQCSSLPTHSSLSTEQTDPNVQDPNDFIYHVAKSRSGQLYLRVRRSFHLDQGILIYSKLFLFQYSS